jgi:hypothetical protein
MEVFESPVVAATENGTLAHYAVVDTGVPKPLLALRRT